VNREQSAFLLGGVVLGLVLGLVIGLIVMREPVSEPGAAPAGAMGASRGTGAAPEGGLPQAAPGGMDPGAKGEAMMGQVQQALQNLKAAVERNPDDLSSLTQLGDMYFDAGMYQEARGYYERATQVNPKDPQLFAAAALAELNLGNPKGALDRCGQALAVDATFWPAVAYSVIAAVEMGDKATAAHLLDRLNTLNPGFEHMQEFQQRVASMGTGPGAPAAPGP